MKFRAHRLLRIAFFVLAFVVGVTGWLLFLILFSRASFFEKVSMAFVILTLWTLLVGEVLSYRKALKQELMREAFMAGHQAKKLDARMLVERYSIAMEYASMDDKSREVFKVWDRHYIINDRLSGVLTPVFDLPFPDEAFKVLRENKYDEKVYGAMSLVKRYRKLLEESGQK